MLGPWKDLKDQGDQAWRDTVRLTDVGYNVIASLVLQSNVDLSSKPEVPSSRPGKRPREDHQWGGKGCGRPASFWHAGGRRRY